MIGPTVHELEQCRARNEFLEREHARLMVVVSEQADRCARLEVAWSGVVGHVVGRVAREKRIPRCATSGAPVAIARRDYRYGTVTLTTTIGELREHVEWLESIAPDDGATRHWRKALDDIDPPGDQNPSEK